MLPIFVGTSVVGVGQTYTVIPLMPAIARDWGIALSATTWLATGFSLSFAIGFLFAGPAADRYGPRKVILVGLLGPRSRRCSSPLPRVCPPPSRSAVCRA